MPLPPILIEDDTLLALAKPAGLPVAHDRLVRKGDTLMAQLQKERGPGLINVHRLDAETSGVVLFAKSKPALDFLSGQFQGRTVQQVYHAIVAVLPLDETAARSPIRAESGGLPEDFVVDLGLSEDEANAGRMRVNTRHSGRPALTEFHTAENFGRFALVECRPVTSRTHQVRLHLATAGAPVLNDALYGAIGRELRLSELKKHYKGREEEKPLIGCLALHATSLTLRHPSTRESFTVEAPLPREFTIALKYLRKYSPPQLRR